MSRWLKKTFNIKSDVKILFKAFSYKIMFFDMFLIMSLYIFFSKITGYYYLMFFFLSQK